MKKKKMIFGILVVIIILIVILFSKGKNESTKKYEDIVWDKLVLGSKLPEPTKLYGEIGVDLETGLLVTLLNFSKEDYIKYKEKCIKENFIIEKDETDETYVAFNDEGYLVRLVYSTKGFNIHLDAPEEMAEIEWPTTGLATLVPIPSSSNGRIPFNNNNDFIVHLSNMSKDDLNSYKEQCKEVGFNDVDLEGSGVYRAKDKSGNELHLIYLGFNNIEIAISSDNSLEQTKDEKAKDNNESEFVYYSTNDKTTVKNGNTGVYAYRNRGEQYYNYYIINFDDGFVYFFSEGNGSEICDKVKIGSGNLNSTLIITYHDGNYSWDERMYFKYKNQPDYLILEDSDYFKFDFYSTDLDEALKIRDKKEIILY